MKKTLRKPIAAYGILLFLSVLLIAGCQKKDASVNEKKEQLKKPETTSVIGGGAVDISVIPYQARLFSSSSGAAGIIIGDRWILTAAHVIGNASPSAFTVYVGSSTVNSGASYSVDAIYPHENFSSVTVGNNTLLNNDIALFHLSTPIVFGPNVQPLQYYNSGVNLSVNQIGTASGWGQTTWHGANGTDFSSLLKSVDITITDLSDPSKIVASSASGAGTNDGICWGDSGGPFTINDSQFGKVLAGISSRSDCSSGISEFTNVAYYTGWIMEKTGIHYMSISGPSSFCSSGTYSISNLPAGTIVNWALSQPGLGSVSVSGYTATVTRIGYGSTNLIANVLLNGTNQVISKAIDLGYPTPTITTTYNGSAVLGECYQFIYQNPAPGTTYKWQLTKIPGGSPQTLSTLAAVEVCLNEPGRYNLALLISNSCVTNKNIYGTSFVITEGGGPIH